MNPLADRIGLQGPSFAVPLEAGKVAEFERATYARPGTTAIPPTFLFTAGPAWGYTLEHPRGTALAQAGMTGAMSLHGGYAIMFPDGPPQRGTALTARTRIAEATRKAGRRGGTLDIYVMATRFEDGAGRLVAEERTTSILPSTAPSGEARDVTPAEARPVFEHDGGADLIASIEPARTDALVVGAGPGPLAFPPLTLTEIVRYQGAALDLQPMHHDDAYARRGGYPGCFSVGMLHVGALASYGCAWLGTARVRRLEARFEGLQWPGDRLTYAGAVERLGRRDGAIEVDLGLSCTRQTGERTIATTMTFALA
jgi:acyl dehydratase